jgi:hypothetical protein
MSASGLGGRGYGPLEASWHLIQETEYNHEEPQLR